MNPDTNILLISTDHWPARFMGCAGMGNIMTPTLDSLAGDGIRYENMYSECPVCIPARRSMMTGLSPRSHGDRIYDDRLEMPRVPTLASAFRDAGYQAFAVGKLHVYPQRNRIGFDDVILQEEGRCEFGVIDDYQIWLGEQGMAGQEFMHSLGNNTYYTRPWHLPEHAHPTTWATNRMLRQIKRRDPTRPGFYFISYQFPHPPLAPLQAYWDMYREDEMDPPIMGDWVDGGYAMRAMTEARRCYSDKELFRAKRAFFAQCTHIDSQIRLLIGCLREENMLDRTAIVFTSDHGDMLFDHDMVAKRCFYENSANVPFIISGRPAERWRGTVDTRLGCMADIMPTLLDICGVAAPSHVEGISLVGDARRGTLYGEVGEGTRAIRMVRDDRHKLVYYPYGNVSQLFDLQNDRRELRNLAGMPEVAETEGRLRRILVENLHGTDSEWVKNGELIGMPAPEYARPPDYSLYNQRSLHWPAPANYSNLGKNA